MKKNIEPKKVKCPKEIEDKFWLVWSEDRRGYNTTPTLKHPTYDEAMTEAQRLSTKNIGIKFYVACVSEYAVSEAKTATKKLS